LYLLCACPLDGKPNVSLEPPPLNSSVQGQFGSGVSGIFICFCQSSCLYSSLRVFYNPILFIHRRVICVSTSVDLLRQSLRRRRRRLGIGARCRAAKRLVLEITATSIYQKSQHIAFYLPNDGELDCRLLIKQAWRDGKDCYLPVLAPKNSSPPMLFSRYAPGEFLGKNRYGILEPMKSVRILPRVLDLVLVPLVGFDNEGNRIGMGGGYYDKSFAFKAVGSNKIVSKSTPYLMGLAYQLQKIDSIKPQPWDVRLDQVLKT